MLSPEVKLLENSLIVKGVLGYETKTSYVDKFEKRVIYDAFEPAGQSENIFVARNTKTDTWYRIWCQVVSAAGKNCRGHTAPAEVIPKCRKCPE